jgi:hypothetical protein
MHPSSPEPQAGIQHERSHALSRLSIVGLAVETALIIALGCRVTARDQPVGNSRSPAGAVSGWCCWPPGPSW